MQLRPYQARMIERVRQCWDQGDSRVLGVLPTGGGKTETAIELIRQEARPEHRALVIVDRKVLAGQWAERMQRHGIKDVGILQAGNTRAVWAPALVATAQTIKARGIPDGVGLLVIDESHIWHGTHDAVLDAHGSAKVLGLTATPLRQGLGLRFDRMVVGATVAELMAAGHLVQRVRYLAPSQDAIERALEAVEVRAGDFAAGGLSRAMRNRSIIGDVVSTWQTHASGRPTIAFCVDKAHANDLAAEFQAAGIDAACIVDATPDEERADLFRRFEAGDVRVLVSVGVLAVGFDSPWASCAILARPTLSTALYVQQGGRVLRPAPGKDDALILDHAGNTFRHGLLEQFEPPDDLSKVDRRSDKKKRQERAPVWVCHECDAINDKADDACVECGEPRRRGGAVYIVDGDLRWIDGDDRHPAGAVPLEHVKRDYLALRFYAEAKGLKPGWAFFKTAQRHKLSEQQARAVIAYSWRDLPAVPPDPELSRWIRADWQRQQIARRYAAQAAN